MERERARNETGNVKSPDGLGVSRACKVTQDRDETNRGDWQRRLMLRAGIGRFESASK